MDYSVLKKYYIPFDNFDVRFKYKGSCILTVKMDMKSDNSG